MSSKYIMIVEDSRTTRAYLASIIEDINGFTIVQTGSGFEALKLLPLYPFNLIITDINMPDIHGLELVSFIKKSPQYKKIPLIIVTTEGSDRDRQKGLALGADEYLVKPVKPESLQKAVKEYLKIKG